MNRIHNIWSVLCLVVGLVCFVAGRWSVTPEMERKEFPQPPSAKESVVPKEMSKVVAKSSVSKTVHAGGGRHLTFRPPASMKNSADVASPATSASSPAEPASVESLEELVRLVQNSPEVEAMPAEQLAQIKEEMIRGLQESGLPEDEIKLQVESLEAFMKETESLPLQGPAGEVSPEQMVEEFAVSLRQSGMSDEEVELVIKGVVAETTPGEPESQ